MPGLNLHASLLALEAYDKAKHKPRLFKKEERDGSYSIATASFWEGRFSKKSKVDDVKKEIVAAVFNAHLVLHCTPAEAPKRPELEDEMRDWQVATSNWQKAKSEKDEALGRKDKVLKLIHNLVLPKLVLEESGEAKALLTKYRAATTEWLDKGAMVGHLTAESWLEQAKSMSEDCLNKIAALDAKNAELRIKGHKLRPELKETDEQALAIRSFNLSQGITRSIATRRVERDKVQIENGEDIQYLEKKLGSKKFGDAQRLLVDYCKDFLRLKDAIEKDDRIMQALDKKIDPKSDDRKMLKTIEETIIDHIKDMKGWPYIGREAESIELLKMVLASVDSLEDVMLADQNQRKSEIGHEASLITRELKKNEKEIAILRQRLQDIDKSKREVASYLLVTKMKEILDYDERVRSGYYKKLEMMPFMNKSQFDEFQEEIREMNERIAERNNKLDLAFEKYYNVGNTNEQMEKKWDLVKILNDTGSDTRELLKLFSYFEENFSVEKVEMPQTEEMLFNLINHKMQYFPSDMEKARLVPKVTADMEKQQMFGILEGLCNRYCNAKNEVAAAKDVMKEADLKKDLKEAILALTLQTEKWEGVFTGTDEEISQKMKEVLERMYAAKSEVQKYRELYAEYLSKLCKEYCIESTKEEREIIRDLIQLAVGTDKGMEGIDIPWLSDLLKAIDVMYPPISNEEKQRLVAQKNLVEAEKRIEEELRVEQQIIFEENILAGEAQLELEELIEEL